ncbi:MAG: 2-C-methyl-D-erythritol 2,4-cyclodiphosphate synthase [Candidatus Moranbacteria bacterium]|nr:2-C-methyl-D-erythritol 2,4-cyclodiphosphate synthase [Candidatus Moranbacteria bacterium]
MKTGIGEDSHKFCKDKKLILGGVEIDYEFGLKANSDGDVIAHCLCNAFDVVCNLGSLSNYADEMLQKGIFESLKYLEFIYQEAFKKGWKINAISISVEAKLPKLEKSAVLIKRSLAKTLDLKTNNIGLTFTSGEGLSEFAKGKGIKAVSVITFQKL